MPGRASCAWPVAQLARVQIRGGAIISPAPVVRLQSRLRWLVLVAVLGCCAAADDGPAAPESIMTVGELRSHVLGHVRARKPVVLDDALIERLRCKCGGRLAARRAGRRSECRSSGRRGGRFPAARRSPTSATWSSRTADRSCRTRRASSCSCTWRAAACCPCPRTARRIAASRTSTSTGTSRRRWRAWSGRSRRTASSTRGRRARRSSTASSSQEDRSAWHPRRGAPPHRTQPRGACSRAPGRRSTWASAPARPPQ